MRSAFWLACTLFFCCFFNKGYVDEIFDPTLEQQSLQNIRQVTFPQMGFEKAGEGYFSPDGQSIVFQAVPKGETQYQIYLLRLDEGIPRMVSTGRGACTCAYFHPDGKKIIFASSHSDPQLQEGFQSAPGYQRQGGQYLWEFTPYMNIYEANLDGSELTPLTTGPDYHAECTYSHDGKQIVFASNSDGSMNLYIMKADGSDVRQITHTKGCYNGGPFFSPDDNRVLFRADYEKPHYLQIYQIDADGQNLRQLTSNEAVNWAPFWHPDDQVIAFTTSLHGHMHYEIYLMNIASGVTWRLTHNPTFDGLPAFSPDGSKLLWTSKRGPDNTSQLFIADFIMPKQVY